MRFKTSYIIALISFSAVILMAGSFLTKFDARSQGDKVILSWISSSESDLNHYSVERKTVNGNFIELGKVYPESDLSYEFIDDTAYKSNDAIYIYRLKIVDNSNTTSYSSEISVSHSVSSVKRTWGSIKALFR
ncbi:MAG: hypothetical protein CMF23_04205 [Ignavibacteriae bacterium]|mgnify:CR=1 FL=1|jgi:hypothetical protein|nr:hypothetical protein [Ignavibacteriota bacterium]